MAKLDEEQQQGWLQIDLDAADEQFAAVPTRRLRKSITAGRLLTSEEMMIDPADRGRLNHIPFLNRLNAWRVQMKANSWLKRATRDQKENIVRTLPAAKLKVIAHSGNPEAVVLFSKINIPF